MDEKDNETQDHVLARCIGLKNGCARKKETNQLAIARLVNKVDGPFYCSKCLSEAIVRKCADKDDHFAHKANLMPVIKKHDQELHNKCRDILLDAMKKAYPEGSWESERPINEVPRLGTKKIIPDISGRIGNFNAASKKGKPVAIEIQLTPYTVKRIHDKLSDYKKLGIYTLYIIPLKRLIDEKYEFRPRLYEKYLHSIYYGRVYYWAEEWGDKIMPIHYGKCYRYIEAKEFHERETGEEKVTGGYDLAYKTIKKPVFGELVDITKDLACSTRPEWAPKNDNLKVPECNILFDNRKKWWKRDVKEDYNNVNSSRDNLPVYLSQYEPLDDYDEWEESVIEV